MFLFYLLTTLGDEDMYEDQYGDEMEYEEEVGEEDEVLSDEDEDIEGIGPIEGLSGDHNLNVEVIMNDDDDEIGEDEEGTSGEDDEEDSEDSEDDDDDARVEIIDEAEEIDQLAEDEEEIGAWESDEEDAAEVDFEGQAADQEEARVHGLNDVDGALGHLLRTLGGGEDAADIIERMEAEGIDVGDDEQLAGEYMEEIDDEGKGFVHSWIRC